MSFRGSCTAKESQVTQIEIPHQKARVPPGRGMTKHYNLSQK